MEEGPKRDGDAAQAAPAPLLLLRSRLRAAQLLPQRVHRLFCRSCRALRRRPPLPLRSGLRCSILHTSEKVKSACWAQPRLLCMKPMSLRGCVARHSLAGQRRAHACAFTKGPRAAETFKHQKLEGLYEAHVLRGVPEQLPARIQARRRRQQRRCALQPRRRRGRPARPPAAGRAPPARAGSRPSPAGHPGQV